MPKLECMAWTAGSKITRSHVTVGMPWNTKHQISRARFFHVCKHRNANGCQSCSRSGYTRCLWLVVQKQNDKTLTMISNAKHKQHLLFSPTLYLSLSLSRARSKLFKCHHPFRSPLTRVRPWGFFLNMNSIRTFILQLCTVFISQCNPFIPSNPVFLQRTINNLLIIFCWLIMCALDCHALQTRPIWQRHSAVSKLRVSHYTSPYVLCTLKNTLYSNIGSNLLFPALFLVHIRLFHSTKH